MTSEDPSRLTTRTQKPDANLEDAIIFRAGGHTFTLPVEYGFVSSDRIPPLVAELAEAMFTVAVLKERRRLGAKETGQPLDIRFEEQEAQRRIERMWSRIENAVRIDRHLVD